MVRRLSTRTRQGQSADPIRLALLDGKAYQADQDDRPLTIPSHKELRATWGKDRNTLLPAFIEANPGVRPWAWWQFDSPEPIRPQYNWPLHVEHRINGVRKRDRWKPCPESQLAYLQEHDLLSAAEIKQLGL